MKEIDVDPENFDDEFKRASQFIRKDEMSLYNYKISDQLAFAEDDRTIIPYLNINLNL